MSLIEVLTVTDTYQVASAREAIFTIHKEGKGTIYFSDNQDDLTAKARARGSVGDKIITRTNVQTFVRATGDGWKITIDESLSEEQTLVAMGDSPSIDAFSRLRTSELGAVFQDKQIHALNDSSWEQQTDGAGAINFATNEPIVELSVGTASGDKALNQTTRYFAYVPGKSNLIKMTGIFDATKANLLQQWLYGDDLNAMGLEIRGLDVNFLIRSSTSGAAVDDAVEQANWNIDKLDGTGPSGITLDMTKNQILIFDFQWLGAGRVRFGFDIDGVIIYAHKFNHANIIDTAYTATPTLPLRYLIENLDVTASASTLKQLCCSVESEGGFILPGIELSTPARWANQRTITARTPILAIRLKNTINGKPNRRTAQILDMHQFAGGENTIFEMTHLHAPSAITATWSDIGDSGLEFSTDITAVTGNPEHVLDGNIIAATPGVGGPGTSELLVADIINAHSFISQNIDSNNSQMFAIFAEGDGSPADVLAAMTFLVSE